ncbi:hypothetical protein GQ600_26794 [Phytophthora cactorum]|nr:hypothetical protein GQ600_26794 [Phytophthora cactorum]
MARRLSLLLHICPRRRCMPSKGRDLLSSWQLQPPVQKADLQPYGGRDHLFPLQRGSPRGRLEAPACPSLTRHPAPPRCSELSCRHRTGTGYRPRRGERWWRSDRAPLSHGTSTDECATSPAEYTRRSCARCASSQLKRQVKVGNQIAENRSIINNNKVLKIEELRTRVAVRFQRADLAIRERVEGATEHLAAELHVAHVVGGQQR